eukprot:TRINITY_DN16025_c0_g1_i1.p1 TRINITY_DN16025_c0_g1~~TRINITY_DN16025_c0_g1_i1.p1  ORF type:complete len:395 (-),score=92.50 TRINITY_DN16025_c0_g1_i1:285-1469(-)
MCIRDRMDPVTLLRDFANGEIQVVEEAGELVLGETRLSKSTPVSLANKQFELAQLWCFLHHNQHKPNVDKTAYRRDCRAKKVQPVRILDIQDVVNFFTADTSHATPRKIARIDEPQEAVAPVTELDDGKKTVHTEKLIRTHLSVLLGPCDYQQRVYTIVEEVRRRSKEKEAQNRRTKSANGSEYQRDKAWESRRSDPDMSALGIDDSGSNMTAKPTRLGKPAPPPREKAVVPILVVPTGRSATVNMFNVKRFLEDGKFETVQDAMKRNGTKKEAKLFVKPNKFVHDPKLQMVEIIDSVKGLRDKDWGRVMGVLVQGPEWQFKDWRWKEIPEIFSRVTAFHVCFDDEDKHPNVVKWSLRILEANKENRGKDLALAKHFWSHLSHCMAKQRTKRKR